MQTTPFMIEKVLNAPVETVWNAISDKEQMKQWYFDLSAFRPEVGFEFEFTGKGTTGEEYVHLCKITEAVPGSKLAYSWAYKNRPGYSVVTFELFPEGNTTRLKLTHEGIESFHENGPDFAKESFAMGWTELISKLLPDYLGTL